YAAALFAGIALRFENAVFVLRNSTAAKDALLSAMRVRSAAAPAPLFDFIDTVLKRFWIYYEWHLLVLTVLLVLCIWRYLRQKPQAKVGGQLATILVIALSDCAWMALVHQHTYIHAHTIHQIGPAICLILALCVSVLLQSLRVDSSRFRLAVSALLVLVGAASFLNLGVVARQCYGNLVVRDDWTYRIKMMGPTAAILRPGSIIVSGIGQQPEIEYALRDQGFVYVNRPLDTLPLQELEAKNLPIFIITR